MIRILAILVLSAQVMEAATLCVRPTSTGGATGADWNNALGASFTPVRGNTYYLADGTYGSKEWSVANSSTTTITIKKATASDHVTETGWSSTLGDGQADFDWWDVLTDYWIFDGQTRNADWKSGAVNQYGINVSGSGPGAAMRLDNGAGSGADNSTFRYIDFNGGGEGTGDGDDVIYGLAGHSAITFSYCALRDSDRTIFLQRGCWQNLIVEYCYIARNNSTPAIHGEMLSDTCSDGTIFRYNFIEEIEGTAIWAVLNGSGSKAAGNTANGWKIYGNEIKSATDNAAAGVIFVANDGSQQNWMDNLYFANNSVHQWGGPYIVYMDIAGTANACINNVFYSPTSITVTWSNPGTLSYNWYNNSITVNGDSGTGKTVCSSSCSSYFADPAGGDLTLVAAIAGTSLASEFNTDMNGNTRGADGTWDRGAYEFGGGGGGTTGGGDGTTSSITTGRMNSSGAAIAR